MRPTDGPRNLTVALLALGFVALVSTVLAIPRSDVRDRARDDEGPVTTTSTWPDWRPPPPEPYTPPPPVPLVSNGDRGGGTQGGGGAPPPPDAPPAPAPPTPPPASAEQSSTPVSTPPPSPPEPTTTSTTRPAPATTTSTSAPTTSTTGPPSTTTTTTASPSTTTTTAPAPEDPAATLGAALRAVLHEARALPDGEEPPEGTAPPEPVLDVTIADGALTVTWTLAPDLTEDVATEHAWQEAAALLGAVLREPTHEGVRVTLVAVVPDAPADEPANEPPAGSDPPDGEPPTEALRVDLPPEALATVDPATVDAATLRAIVDALDEPEPPAPEQGETDSAEPVE